MKFEIEQEASVFVERSYADGTATDGHGACIKPTVDADRLYVARCQLETYQDAASDLTDQIGCLEADLRELERVIDERRTERAEVLGDCAALAAKIKNMESK